MNTGGCSAVPHEEFVVVDEDIDFSRHWFAPDERTMTTALSAAAAQQQRRSEGSTGSGGSMPRSTFRRREGPEGEEVEGDAEDCLGDQQEEEIEEPEEFMFCPISQEVMINPTLAPDGFTYEYDNIFSWVSQKHTSPMTRQPMTTDQLRENRVLKDVIDRWKLICKTAEEKIIAQHQRALQLREQEQTREFITNWQRDETAPYCIHCCQAFGPLRRRHHCRCCGYIFCHRCCSALGKLNGSENLERICVRCALRYGGACSETPAAANGEGGGDQPPAMPAPVLVVVPPSWSNYFHLGNTSQLAGGVADSTQSWVELLQSKAPVVQQWLMDTGSKYWKSIVAAAQGKDSSSHNGGNQRGEDSAVVVDDGYDDASM